MMTWSITQTCPSPTFHRFDKTSGVELAVRNWRVLLWEERANIQDVILVEKKRKRSNNIHLLHRGKRREAVHLGEKNHHCKWFDFLGKCGWRNTGKQRLAVRSAPESAWILNQGSGMRPEFISSPLTQSNQAQGRSCRHERYGLAPDFTKHPRSKHLRCKLKFTVWKINNASVEGGRS